MRFNLTENASPIELKIGAETVILQHRLLTGTERMTAMELCATGLSASMRYLYSFLIGWDGVEDDHGRPMQFGKEYITPDGVTHSNVDMVMGRFPFSKQVEAWAVQMAHNGVTFKGIKQLLAEFVDEETQRRLEKMLDPLGKLQCSEGTKSSATSSPTETPQESQG